MESPHGVAYVSCRFSDYGELLNDGAAHEFGFLERRTCVARYEKRDMARRLRDVSQVEFVTPHR